MQIHKNFSIPEYKSTKEFQDKAEEYFENELNPFLLANPKHNLEFSKCAKHRHYLGYKTLEKGWEIRQPEVDRLKKKIRKLEEEIKRYSCED